MNELSGQVCAFQDVGNSLPEELDLLTIVARNFRIQLLLNSAYFTQQLFFLLLQPRNLSVDNDRLLLALLRFPLHFKFLQSHIKVALESTLVDTSIAEYFFHGLSKR